MLVLLVACDDPTIRYAPESPTTGGCSPPTWSAPPPEVAGCTSIETDGSGVTTRTYDAAGHEVYGRVERTGEPIIEVSTTWDGDLHLRTEIRQDGVLTEVQENTWSSDDHLVLARIDNDGDGTWESVTVNTWDGDRQLTEEMDVDGDGDTDSRATLAYVDLPDGGVVTEYDRLDEDGWRIEWVRLADAEGNPLVEDYRYEVAEVVEWRVEYTWASCGRLLTQDFHRADGTERSRTTWDERFRRVRWAVDVDDDGTDDLIQRWTWDDADRPLTEETDDGAEPPATRRWTWAADGSAIERGDLDRDGAVDVETRYDPDGRLLSFVEDADEDGVEDQRTEYLWDAGGRPLRETWWADNGAFQEVTWTWSCPG